MYRRCLSVHRNIVVARIPSSSSPWMTPVRFISSPPTSGDKSAATGLLPPTSPHTLIKNEAKTLEFNLANNKKVNKSSAHTTRQNLHIALLKIGGGVLEPPHIHRLVDSIASLQKEGMTPIVVHGGGPQLNLRLEKSGEDPKYNEGIRITSPKVLSIAMDVFNSENLKLVEALESAGIKARPVTGAFAAELMDQKIYGLVGKVVDVVTTGIASAILDGYVPVLTSLGLSPSTGQILNINADVAALELAKTIQPLKIMFINTTAGMLDGAGQLMTRIVLNDEYENLLKQPWVKHGTRLKLKEIKNCLDQLPPSSSVSITSPSHAISELHSPTGLGTFISLSSDPSSSSSEKQATTANAPITRKQTTPTTPYRIGLLGGRGHTGAQIINILAKHPHAKLVCATSATTVGALVSSVSPSAPPDLKFSEISPSTIVARTKELGIDAWILALHDKGAEEYVKEITKDPNHPILIDLSADHRFDENWVYGQPEGGNRNAVANAKLIANPGCYATGMYLTLAPLLKKRLVALPSQFFGVSGYSGAGTKPSPKNDKTRLSDNMMPYSLVSHNHEREVSHQLGFPIHFAPHVGQWFQGITLTGIHHLTETLSPSQISEIYTNYYKDEPLVKVLTNPGDMPEVKDNSGKHHVVIGGFTVDKQTGRLVTVTTLDNLLKGAATQAIQNLNLALGLPDELTVIRSDL
eukprot:TRINITY_DN4102_c0_g1_i1.p1 TRINITY_DN4102_c0_g1~~TRINITY_DN4102_c0_g1_i1.p1  ORF type:complete len:694 (+),score=223.34 TRINITY_DN4102_c0_g1_i1:60-2141(+)